MENTDTVHDDQRTARRDLVGHLHAVREAERISLATAMHDELGGSLVAAVMDISWVEQHLLADNAGEIAQHLIRARASLRSAIDLERLMTERLRPTLLDNFGLFAAFRWLFKQTSAHARSRWTDRYPAAELSLTPTALTGLFRIVEEMLQVCVAEPILQWVDLSVSVDVSDLRILITLGHAGGGAKSVNQWAANQLDDVVHRVRSLNGVLQAERRSSGASFDVVVPLSNILLAA